MEDNLNITINMNRKKVRNVIHNRRVLSLFFGITICFFFFNFATVSCQKQEIIAVKGISFVTGKTVPMPSIPGTDTTQSALELPVSPFAVVALLSTLLGMVLCLFLKSNKTPIMGASLAFVAFVSLIAVQITSHIYFSKYLDEYLSPFVSMIKIKFMPGYWLALTSTALAMVICCLQIKRKKVDEIASQEQCVVESVREPEAEE